MSLRQLRLYEGWIHGTVLELFSAERVILLRMKSLLTSRSIRLEVRLTRLTCGSKAIRTNEPLRKF